MLSMTTASLDRSDPGSGTRPMLLRLTPQSEDSDAADSAAARRESLSRKAEQLQERFFFLRPELERLHANLAGSTADTALCDLAEEQLRNLEETGEKRTRDFIAFRKARGRRYAHCRLDNFETYNERQRREWERLTAFSANLGERIDYGQNVVLFGPTGTGKDHLLTGLIELAILRYGKRVVWRSGVELFAEFRDRIGEQRPERDAMRTFTIPDVLALSDPIPPFGTLTDFQVSLLFRIVDRRYSERKPTWVTMNVAKGEEAEKHLGPQVVDRLRHGALTVFCDWPSYRVPATEPETG